MRPRHFVWVTIVLLVVVAGAVVVGVGPFGTAAIGAGVTATDAPTAGDGAGDGASGGGDTASQTPTSTSTATATATETPAPRVHTPSGGYEWATVTVHDADGGNATLAAVDVRLADTTQKRYTGLSDTESLAADEGMFFVHPQEGQYAYVMRSMDFPLDIVFVGANGTITRIHHAPTESDNDDLTRYRGVGKYVLEVPMDYTAERGIEEGDTIRVHERDLNGSGGTPASLQVPAARLGSHA
jgi:uncharacterized membrane protein (UPF0127 family)